VARDELPTDSQVIKDYGFDRCSSLEDKKMLFGLYRDISELGLGPIHLNEWRAKGTLLDSIKKNLNDRPDHLRGQHFGWLLENQNVLGDVDKQKREGTPEG
jgi:hypothetical protein